MIRIGNQTSFSARPTNLPYHYALAAGFEAFEWFSDPDRGGWRESEVDGPARGRLREQAAEHGILFSVHAPLLATPLTEEGSSLIRSSIAFCSDVGGSVVNIHLDTRLGPAEFARSLVPLLDLAGQSGVRISIENTPDHTPNDFNDVFAELRCQAIPPLSVGMCFDMGHANLCHVTRNNFVGYMDALQDHVPIIHWHAHENWGDRDAHIPLFRGPSAKNEAGIRALIARLIWRRFEGSIVLEQWPTPPEILAATASRLRMLLDAATGRDRILVCA